MHRESGVWRGRGGGGGADPRLCFHVPSLHGENGLPEMEISRGSFFSPLTNSILKGVEMLLGLARHPDVWGKHGRGVRLFFCRQSCMLLGGSARESTGHQIHFGVQTNPSPANHRTQRKPQPQPGEQAPRAREHPKAKPTPDTYKRNNEARPKRRPFVRGWLWLVHLQYLGHPPGRPKHEGAALRSALVDTPKTCPLGT